MNGVSLIVCCHNSSSKIPQTIDHINCLSIASDIKFELIIVDNASSDETPELAVKLLSDKMQNYAKIVSEENMGLRYARLKGIAESKYEYICFIDDDNWICRDWINVVYEIMSDHPEVGACGGVGVPSFESPPPPWFEKYKGCYAVGVQGESSGYVDDSRGYLWGAGLTIRRSAWEEILNNGFSFTLSGRKGANLSSGEDTEMCFAIRCYGWRLWYDERLLYYHYLPSSRLTWGYLKRLLRGFGASNIVLDAYREFFNLNVDSMPVFKHIWIYDTLSIIRNYRKRYAQLITVHFEAEGSHNVLGFHGKIGKLVAILSLRHKYDELKSQIYDFVRHSKKI